MQISSLLSSFPHTLFPFFPMKLKDSRNWSRNQKLKYFLRSYISWIIKDTNQYAEVVSVSLSSPWLRASPPPISPSLTVSIDLLNILGVLPVNSLSTCGFSRDHVGAGIKVEADDVDDGSGAAASSRSPRRRHQGPHRHLRRWKWRNRRRTSRIQHVHQSVVRPGRQRRNTTR